VSKLFETTEQSGSHDKIHDSLKGKKTLNFDEFFQFSKQLIEEQIKKDPSLIIDASEVQASCLLCPYTSDVPKSAVWYFKEIFVYLFKNDLMNEEINRKEEH